MSARYAIYYAPEDGGVLEALGRSWLGRDARTGKAVDRPEVPGIAPNRLHAITEDPRRYGFHGTLKPPFALAGGHDREGLVEAIERFAAGRAAFAIPALRLAELGSFLALVPGSPCAELDALAADCVRAFDPYRAPPSEAELLRRKASGLSPRQERYLAEWGYPYVFDEFRFHLTLTGRVPDAEERATVRAFLESVTAPVCREPVEVVSLCLFEQPDREAPFILTRRFVFG
ncbi:MAG TPA: DUF1045 domain-containing protein [Alphaproteobacteria bacterium]|nr:DUF1045 domain-containing protein [Alphaproteobacteria bacterium]